MGETVTIFSSPDNGDMSALTDLADAVSVSIKEGSAAVADEKTSGEKKWVCKICGYVYEGDEVPEDYKFQILKTMFGESFVYITSTRETKKK